MIGHCDRCRWWSWDCTRPDGVSVLWLAEWRVDDSPCIAKVRRGAKRCPGFVEDRRFGGKVKDTGDHFARTQKRKERK